MISTMSRTTAARGRTCSASALLPVAGLLFLLGGCQQVVNPDGSIGYRVGAAPMQGPGPMQGARTTGNEKNDPYVRAVVPDQAIVNADAEFYQIGLYQMPAVVRRCEADARRGRGNIPRCWALDIHAMMINVARVNIRHEPSLPGLDPDSAKRRWMLYATALGVPPDRYKMVEDGTFQRVAAMAMTQH